MLTKNNWAFFISKDEIAWSFAQNDDPSFKDSLLRLTRALQSFGQEFLGDAIGTLTISDNKNKELEPLTIIFIRLSPEMYLVISQPDTTALLLELMESFQMPEILRDQVRGVLIGAALSTYSKFWGSELFEQLQPKIDDIFQHCIRLIGAEQRAVVENGTCSLAELTMPELILFHHYLQKQLQAREEFQSLQEWALVADRAGSPIHLIWNLEEQFATSLAGLLSVIHMFTDMFFGYKPQEMTFGISNMQKLSFFTGNDTFCVMAQPRSLLKRPSFQRALLKVKKHVLSDIQEELRAYIAQEIAMEYAARMKTVEFTKLLATLTSDTSEMPEVQLSIDNQIRQVQQFIQRVKSSGIPLDNEQTQSCQVLILGATETVKQLFNEFFPVKNRKTMKVGDFNFEMIEISHESSVVSRTYHCWFVPRPYLDDITFYLLSNSIFNPDCLIVPYSFKEKVWLPPITRYIELYWNHSGKSAISTIILLLEGKDDHIYYKEAQAHYMQLKKNIKQPDRIQLLPVTHPNKESLNEVLELITALKTVELQAE